MVWGSGSTRKMGAIISARGGPGKLNKLVWLQGTGPGSGEVNKSAAVKRRLLVSWPLNCYRLAIPRRAWSELVQGPGHWRKSRSIVYSKHLEHVGASTSFSLSEKKAWLVAFHNWPWFFTLLSQLSSLPSPWPVSATAGHGMFLLCSKNLSDHAVRAVPCNRHSSLALIFLGWSKCDNTRWGIGTICDESFSVVTQDSSLCTFSHADS